MLLQDLAGSIGMKNGWMTTLSVLVVLARVKLTSTHVEDQMVISAIFCLILIIADMLLFGKIEFKFI